MLNTGIVEVPKQAFLWLAEAFLSEGRTLYLIVEGMTEKKEFGCDHCGAKIESWSPDDSHIILELDGGSGSLERKIKCQNCGKENIRYWRASGGRPIVKSM
jgi:hypothetical protein